MVGREPPSLSLFSGGSQSVQKKRLKWGIKVPSTGPPNPSCEKGRRQEPEGGHRGRSEASPNLGLSVTRLGQRRSSDGRGPEPAGPGVDVGRETGQETPLPCQPQGQGGQRGSWASRRLRARLASQPPAPTCSLSLQECPVLGGSCQGKWTGPRAGARQVAGGSDVFLARARVPRGRCSKAVGRSCIWGCGSAARPPAIC